jgi:hypothetical protein
VASATSSRGSQIVGVAFDEPILCSTAVASAFTVSVDGSDTAVRRVDCTGTSASSVSVSIGTAPGSGDEVQVWVGKAVTDRAGNPLGSRSTATAGVGSGDAPVLEVSSGPTDQSFTRLSNPSWLGHATSGRHVTRIEVSFDGSAFGSPSTLFCDGCPGAAVDWRYHPPSSLPEGAHTVAFRAVDDSGVLSPVVTIRFTVDTTLPALRSLTVTADDPSTTLTFSEAILCSTVAAEDFTATINGTAVAVTAVACSGPASATVGVTLERAPVAGETVAERPVSTSAVTDRAGNPLQSAAEVSATVPGGSGDGGGDGTGLPPLG